MIIAKKNENLTQEEMIEFKNKQIKKFSKFLKENPNFFKEADEKRNEELENTNESNNMSFEELMKNDDFVDKMCDIMDGVSMNLSGEDEKKRILKASREFAKGNRILKSQMSRDERIEEFKKKASKKK